VLESRCWKSSGSLVWGMPKEVKKSSITSSARSCRTVDPRRFCELHVSACVLVFRRVSGTVPHDMHRTLVLRPGIGIEKRGS
jgi:hypothetical protein